MAVKSMEPVWFTPAPIRGRYLQGLWKDSPSAPATPDPVITANAQGVANVDAAKATAALNRANQYTPYGSLTWQQGGDKYDSAGYTAAMKAWETAGGSKEGSTAGAAPTQAAYGYDPLAWSSTTKLDPRVQALLDSSLATSKGLQGSIDNALAQTSSTLKQSLTTPGKTSFQTVTTPDQLTHAKIEAPGETDRPNVEAIQEAARARYTDLTPSLKNSAALATQGQAGVASQLERLQGLYSKDLNYDKAPAMPVANEATRKTVEDALYKRATARLDPKYTQATDSLNTQLAAQGITQGSEAYNRELTNFNNSKNDAYSSATNDAISQSNTAMQQLFNQQLQARQQGVTEANTLRTNPTQEALAISGLTSGLDSSARNWYGAEAGQNSAADSSASTAYNMQRTNSQDAFNNMAAAAQGNFAMDTQASQNAFNNKLAAAQANFNMSNTANQGDFQNTLAQRNQVLNELNALRTGAQAQNPTFQNTNSGATVGAAPIAQSAYNSYQGQLGAYNTQVGSDNAMIGGLTSLGAAGIGGLSAGGGAGWASLAAMFSDRRLKKNIVATGETLAGCPVYEYEYIWGGGRRKGVMAQEAPAHAVVMHPSGYLMVNYAALGA